MDEHPDGRARRGLADLDAAASTSWLPWTGLPWGLVPVVGMLVVVLAAVEGMVVAGAGLALGAGVVVAHLLLRRR